MALDRTRPLAPAPPHRALTLAGAVAVPHSRETATRHLVGACVSGALGPGLRIVHRDREVIRFRAATVWARLLGPAAGTLTVGQDGARTVVGYALSVAGILGLAALLGLAAGGLAAEVLRADPRTSDPLFALGGAVAAAIVVAGAVAGALAHRARVRFETLLHNLRYLS